MAVTHITTLFMKTKTFSPTWTGFGTKPSVRQKRCTETKALIRVNGRTDGWGAEHGGVLTYDEKAIKFWEVDPGEPPVNGSPGRMLNFSEQIKDVIVRAKAEGGTGRVLFDIHTHGVSEPYQQNIIGAFSTEQEHYGPQSWDPALVTSPKQLQKPSDLDTQNQGLGIVLYGKRQFKVYGPGNTDIETLKNTCIKLSP